MREILFRGKRKDNGEWVEGYYCEFHNRPHVMEENSCQIFEPRPSEDAYFLGSGIGGFWHIIDRETLGQFTGKFDKNGKRIFEGDIVLASMCYGPAGMLPTVASISFTEECGWQFNYFDMESIVVIDNIHDNPGLVKLMNDALRGCIV